MTESQVDDPDYLLAHLWPLTKGQSVKLVIEQTKQHGKVSRVVQKGLLIAPGKVYGLHDQAMVVSLLGSGSCVIFPNAQSSKGELVKAGLSARLATALIESLKKLHGDANNGSAKTHKTRRTRR